MNKKGISLVALVITIIVLIILTGAVIATFVEGGIIDQAKDAVKRSDYTTLREVYDTAYNVSKIDIATGVGGEIDEIGLLNEKVNELGLKGFTFTENKVSYDGDNDYIRDWIKNKFLFKELSNLGYVFSTIEEKTYMTGIKLRETTVGDILNGLGDEYTVVDNNGGDVAETDTVTTGYKIMKDKEEYATIVVRGDLTADKYINSNDNSCIVDILIAGKYDNIIDALAADMNNDGKISEDDSNFALLIVYDRVDIAELQKGGMNSLPVVISDDGDDTDSDNAIYTWYTKEDVYEKIGTKYTVSNEIITVPSMSCETLEKDIKKLINLNGVKVEIQDEQEDPIEDKSENISTGYYVYIDMPGIISATEYSKEMDFWIEINVQ